MKRLREIRLKEAIWRDQRDETWEEIMMRTESGRGRDKLENDDYFNFKSNMMFEYSNLIRCCERENTKKEMEERPSKREREFI